jgi:hypothetical protein
MKLLNITNVLINIERTRLRYWNKKAKTKRPEQLSFSYLILDVKLQEQGELKKLSSSLKCYQVARLLGWV